MIKLRRSYKDSRIIIRNGFYCVCTRINNDINGNPRFSIDLYNSNGIWCISKNVQAYDYDDLERNLNYLISRVI